MRSIGRSILAVVGGLLVCGLVVFAVESVSNRFFPLPAGTDLTDPAAVRVAVSQLPWGAFLIVLLAWFLGPLAGAWVAAKVAPGSPLLHGMIVAGLVVASAVANMLLVAHPPWMWVAGPAVILAGGWLGVGLARPANRI